MEQIGGAGRQRWVRTTIAVVILAVLLGAPGAAEAADDGTAVLQGQVEAGLDGFGVPGLPTPVRVTLTATELRAGELAVRLGGGPVELVEFEVTGGASEEHWVLLDAPAAPPLTASASARVGGTNVQLDTTVLQWDAGTHLVGTLAGLGGLELDDLSTRIGGQDIHVVDLDPALLDLGPGALAALDSIAVTPDDIANLSERHRDALLGWLALGATLYVDASPGPLVGWPEDLQPTSPVVRAGPATVIATGGALADGRWSDVVVPAPNRSLHEDSSVAQTLPFADPSAELFGVDLGRDLPELPGLLGILAAYTILVGPAAHLAFRRRVMGRWVAIPALAVLATGALYVGGDGPGADAAASVVDVIETGPGSAMATTRVLMATDRGDQEVVAPAGWTARQDDMFGLGGSIGQRRKVDSVEIDVPAPAGGVGLLNARGPVPFDGALEVTASAVDDGTLTGVVRNATDVPLMEVAVFGGRSTSTLLGTLGPGESAEFELTGTTQFEFGGDPFREIWSGPVPGGGWVQPLDAGGRGAPVREVRCDENGVCAEVGVVGDCIGPACGGGVARTDALLSTFRARGVNTLAPGMVTAVGWATDLDPVVELGSDVELVESRTAIVGRSRTAVPGDRLVDAGSVRHLLAASQVNGLLELQYRFDLPSQVGARPLDVTRLRIDLPAIFDRVEILAPDGDHLVRDRRGGVGDAGPGGLQGREEVTVPADAVVDGMVFLRVALPLAAPGPGRDLVIYEAAT